MNYDHLARWLDEQPKDYPDALVTLIDAVRDYLRTNEEIGRQLLREGSITRARFEEVQAEDAPLVEWLKKHEAFGVDPSLGGVIKD